MRDELYSDTTSNGEAERGGPESPEDENSRLAKASLAAFCEDSWVRKKTRDGRTVWASKHCSEDCINLFQAISGYKNKHLAIEKAYLKKEIRTLSAQGKNLGSPSDEKENKKEMDRAIRRYKKIVVWQKKLKKWWSGKPIPDISEPDETILIKCLICGTSTVANKTREIHDTLPVHYRWQMEECFLVLQIRLLDILLAFDFEELQHRYDGTAISRLEDIDNDTVMALWSGFVRESIFPGPILLEVCGIRINRIAVVESVLDAPVSACLTLYHKADSSTIKDQLLLVFFSMHEDLPNNAVERARISLPENFRLRETQSPPNKPGRKRSCLCEIKRIEIRASSGDNPVCILSIMKAKYAKIHLQIFDKNLAFRIEADLKKIVALYMGKNAFGLPVPEDIIASLASKGFEAIVRELESAKPPEETLRNPVVFTFNCRHIVLAGQDENDAAYQEKPDFLDMMEKIEPECLGSFWTAFARCMCKTALHAFVYEHVEGIKRKSNLCSKQKQRLKECLQCAFSCVPEGWLQAKNALQFIVDFLEEFHNIPSSSHPAKTTAIPADLYSGLVLFMDIFENTYKEILHSHQKGNFQAFVFFKKMEKPLSKAYDNAFFKMETEDAASVVRGFVEEIKRQSDYHDKKEKYCLFGNIKGNAEQYIAERIYLDY